MLHAAVDPLAPNVECMQWKRHMLINFENNTRLGNHNLATETFSLQENLFLEDMAITSPQLAMYRAHKMTNDRNIIYISPVY